jgi:hypothetical protein
VSDLLHLDWPFRLGATTLQNSPEELRASAAVIACTPRGWRADDPAFGVTTPLFEQRPVDTDRLTRELHDSDQRLNYAARELLDLTDPTALVIQAGPT